MQRDETPRECGECARNGEDFAAGCCRMHCPWRRGPVWRSSDRVYVTLGGVEHGMSDAEARSLTLQLARLMMERANAS